jgi:hypothetical protein
MVLSDLEKGLGHFNESVALLKNATKYLERVGD